MSGLIEKRASTPDRTASKLDAVLFLALFSLLPIERMAVVDIAGFTIRPVFVVMGLWMFSYFQNIKMTNIIWGLAVTLAVLQSVVFSIDPVTSLPYAAWAMFTIWFSVVFASRIRQHPELVELAVKAYLQTAVFWSLVTVAQWLLAFKYPSLAYSFVGALPRVHALTLEPSYLAVFLLPPLFIALYSEQWLYAVFLGMALFASTSRTGIVALVFGLMMFALFKHKSIFSVFKRRVLLLPILLLALVFFMNSSHKYLHTMSRFFYSGLSLTDPTSAIPRLESWKEAWQVFSDNPWNGVGVGAYGKAVRQLGLSDIEEGKDNQHKTTNLFAEVAAEMGIFGLIAFLVWGMLPLFILSRCTASSPGFAILMSYLVLTVTFPFIQTWWRPYLWVPWVLAVSYGRCR